MRLQLGLCVPVGLCVPARARHYQRPFGRLFATLWALAAAAVLPSSAWGEDRVEVRGVYFREPSTRVVQPMVQITKDLPHGVDLGVHYLMDAITSASVAAGNTQDSLLTEVRNEAGVVVGKTFARTRIGIAYRYSHEPDYFSHTVGLSVSQGVWDNSGSVAVNLALTRDTIAPTMGTHQKLRVGFAGLAYTQALSPTTIAQVGYDLTYLHGFMENPYLRHPNLGREDLPDERVRNALSARIAHLLPDTGTGFQLHYRYYVDQDDGFRLYPWGLVSHSVEGRVYQRLSADVEARLSYRYHSQGAAQFWCSNRPGTTADCYGQSPQFHSIDVKLGALATHMPQFKLLWDAHGLSQISPLAWLARGTFEISYGYYFQSTHYEGGHLLQTGYSLPF